MFLRQLEQFQYPQGRIAEQHIFRQADPSGLKLELANIARYFEAVLEKFPPLAKIGFHRRTENTRQITHITGGQIIAFHKAFDRA